MFQVWSIRISANSSAFEAEKRGSIPRWTISSIFFRNLKLLKNNKLSIMGFIYKITNIINNKCYIGETVQIDPGKRWRKHISSANTTKDCPLLAAAINKYGIDKFKFEILIICFDEDRFEYEKEYILKYNSQRPHGYNILDGGQYGGSRLGTHLSDETKEKISNALKQFHKQNPNNFQKYRDKHLLGLKSSEKWNDAIKQKKIGTHPNNILPKTEEHKIKISEGLNKYFENNGSSDNKKKQSEIMTKINGKQVAQYSKDNILISYYDSIVLAQNTTNINRKTIQAAAAGRLNTGGGFIWKYVNKELKE